MGLSTKPRGSWMHITQNQRPKELQLSLTSASSTVSKEDRRIGIEVVCKTEGSTKSRSFCVKLDGFKTTVLRLGAPSFSEVTLKLYLNENHTPLCGAFGDAVPIQCTVGGKDRTAALHITSLTGSVTKKVNYSCKLVEVKLSWWQTAWRIFLALGLSLWLLLSLCIVWPISFCHKQGKKMARPLMQVCARTLKHLKPKPKPAEPPAKALAGPKTHQASTKRAAAHGSSNKLGAKAKQPCKASQPSSVPTATSTQHASSGWWGKLTGTLPPVACKQAAATATAAAAAEAPTKDCKPEAAPPASKLSIGPGASTTEPFPSSSSSSSSSPTASRPPSSVTSCLSRPSSSSGHANLGPSPHISDDETQIQKSELQQEPKQPAVAGEEGKPVQAAGGKLGAAEHKTLCKKVITPQQKEECVDVTPAVPAAVPATAAQTPRKPPKVHQPKAKAAAVGTVSAKSKSTPTAPIMEPSATAKAVLSSPPQPQPQPPESGTLDGPGPGQQSELMGMLLDVLSAGQVQAPGSVPRGSAGSSGTSSSSSRPSSSASNTAATGVAVAVVQAGLKAPNADNDLDLDPSSPSKQGKAAESEQQQQHVPITEAVAAPHDAIMAQASGQVWLAPCLRACDPGMAVPMMPLPPHLHMMQQPPALQYYQNPYHSDAQYQQQQYGHVMQHQQHLQQQQYMHHMQHSAQDQAQWHQQWQEYYQQQAQAVQQYEQGMQQHMQLLHQQHCLQQQQLYCSVHGQQLPAAMQQAHGAPQHCDSPLQGQQQLSSESQAHAVPDAPPIAVPEAEDRTSDASPSTDPAAPAPASTAADVAEPQQPSEPAAEPAAAAALEADGLPSDLRQAWDSLQVMVGEAQPMAASERAQLQEALGALLPHVAAAAPLPATHSDRQLLRAQLLSILHDVEHFDMGRALPAGTAGAAAASGSGSGNGDQWCLYPWSSLSGSARLAGCCTAADSGQGGMECVEVAWAPFDQKAVGGPMACACVALSLADALCGGSAMGVELLQAAIVAGVAQHKAMLGAPGMQEAFPDGMLELEVAWAHDLGAPPTSPSTSTPGAATATATASATVTNGSSYSQRLGRPAELCLQLDVSSPPAVCASLAAVQRAAAQFMAAPGVYILGSRNHFMVAQVMPGGSVLLANSLGHLLARHCRLAHIMRAASLATFARLYMALLPQELACPECVPMEIHRLSRDAVGCSTEMVPFCC